MLPTAQTILVLNCGSSSIKFAVIDPEDQQAMIKGLVEAIDTAECCLHYQFQGNEKKTLPLDNATFQQSMSAILALLKDETLCLKPLAGVGHRIVHGGEYFKQSTLLDKEALEKIRECISLAPLHNPANLLGVEASQQAFPQLPHVGIFDTAFHQTMPPHAYLYAISQTLSHLYHIRRYGFHGTSHQYVSQAAALKLKRSLHDCNFISAHLGNGCSVCAVKGGSSVDTSMGFTPLEGLVMGTRCGDIDASICGFLVGTGDYTVNEVITLLNCHSGLLGLSGYSNDMRTLTRAAQRGHREAALAIDIFCYRLAKYIASYWVSLQSVDALIFTGGIGENASLIRSRVLAQLYFLGYRLDSQANQHHGKKNQGIITEKESPIAIVINTDEETVIASETLAVITRHSWKEKQ